MKLEPIDTSTTAGKALVMQLAAEGRKVAAMGPESDDWIPTVDDGVLWDWRNWDYAIIAQPVGPDEVFVAIGVGGFPATTAYADRIHADRWVEHQMGTVVRYRRVEE